MDKEKTKPEIKESDSLASLRSKLSAKKAMEDKVMLGLSQEKTDAQLSMEKEAKNAFLLEKKIEELEKKVNELEDENTILQKKANEFSEEKILGLRNRHEKEIEELKIHYEQLLSSATAITDSDSFLEFVKMLEEANKLEIEKERAEKNKSVNSLKKQVDRLKEEISKLKKELAKANRSLNTKVNSSNKKIEELQKKLAKSEKEVELLKSQLAKARSSALKSITEKEVEILRQELEDEKRNLEVIKEEYEVDASYLELYKKAIDDKYSTQIEEFKKTISDLEKEDDKVTDNLELNTLRDELLKRLNDLKASSQKNIVLDSLVKELKAETEDLKEEIKTLKASVKYSEDAEEKELIIKELKQEIESLKENYEKALEEEREKTQDINSKYQELKRIFEENKDVVKNDETIEKEINNYNLEEVSNSTYEEVKDLNRRIGELESLVKGFDSPSEENDDDTVYVFENEFLNKLNNITRTKNALNERLVELKAAQEEALAKNESLKSDIRSYLNDLNSRFVELDSLISSGALSEEEINKYQNDKVKISAQIEQKKAQLFKLEHEETDKINTRFANYIANVNEEIKLIQSEEEKIRQGLHKNPKKTSALMEHQKRKQDSLDSMESSEEEIVEVPLRKEELEEELDKALEESTDNKDEDNLSAMYSSYKKEALDMIDSSRNVLNYTKVEKNIQNYEARLKECKTLLSSNSETINVSALLNEINLLNEKLIINKRAYDELCTLGEVLKYQELEKRIKDIAHMLGK